MLRITPISDKNPKSSNKDNIEVGAGVNGTANNGDVLLSPLDQSKPEETEEKKGERSVLQAKLTKLAIQIGYAGETRHN